jgi:type IV secretory pathway VirJ component
MTRPLLVLALSVAAALPARAQDEGALRHLPVRAYSPEGTPRGGFVFLSGDGGWRSFDKANADSLRAAGWYVLGVDALTLFYHEVSGDSLAALVRLFVASVREHVPAAAPVYLGGYSFGAELAADALPRAVGVDGLYLLGPGRRGVRKITLGGYLFREPHGPTSFDVAERLNDERCTPIVFVTGADDHAGAGALVYPSVRQPAAQFLVPGATHHYDGGSIRYTDVMRQALAWLAANRARCGP